MELKNINFQYRGKAFEGQIALPDDLNEAIETLGQSEVFSAFMIGYVEMQKKRIRTKRQKKWAKLKLDQLTEEQKQTLKEMGII